MTDPYGLPSNAYYQEAGGGASLAGYYNPATGQWVAAGSPEYNAQYAQMLVDAQNGVPSAELGSATILQPNQNYIGGDVANAQGGIIANDPGVNPFFGFGTSSTGGTFVSSDPNEIAEYQDNAQTRTLQGIAKVGALVAGGALAGSYLNTPTSTATNPFTSAGAAQYAPQFSPTNLAATGASMGAPAAALPAGGGVLLPGATAAAPAAAGGTLVNSAAPAAAGIQDAAGNIIPGTEAVSNMAGDSTWWQKILEPFGGGADASAFENVFAALQGLGGLSSLSGGGNTLSDLFGFSNSSADDALRSATIGAHGTAGPGGASTQYDPATGRITASGGNLDPFQAQLAQYAGTQLSQADSAANQQKYLEMLRAQAQPYEQQITNSVNSNLFSRGRLGAEDSTTGLAYRELAKGLSLADLGRQETALRFGEEQTQNIFDRARLSGDLASLLQNRAFAPQAGATNTNIASANAQLGVGTGLTNLGMTTTNPLDALMQYLSSRQP